MLNSTPQYGNRWNVLHSLTSFKFQLIPTNQYQYCLYLGGWWSHDRYFTSGKTVQKNVRGDGKEMKGLPTCYVVYGYTFLFRSEVKLVTVKFLGTNYHVL